MEKLLTVYDVSRMLRGGEKKSRLVYELANKKIIPSAKIGGKILFKESDVENYVQNQFDLQN